MLRAGLLHETDVARIAAMASRVRALMRDDLARGRELRSTAAGVYELDFGRDVTIGIADLRVDVAHGQVVARYALEGASSPSSTDWRPISSGTTIGFRKLDRFEPTRFRKLRLTLETVGPLARPVQLRVYAP
jgi:alpha-L-fucosidase